MSDKAPALHETLRPSMGAAMGRIHRLWRSAINRAVGELGMTEARWAVLLHLVKVGEGPEDGGEPVDVGLARAAQHLAQPHHHPPEPRRAREGAPLVGQELG